MYYYTVYSVSLNFFSKLSKMKTKKMKTMKIMMAMTTPTRNVLLFKI
jgi:hypothetical protein